MERKKIVERALRVAPVIGVSLLAGVGAVAGSYAAAGFGNGFVVGPIASFLTAVMPDAFVTFGILVLGSLGQKLNLLLAVVVGVGLFGSFGFAGVSIARRIPVGGVLLTVLLSWGASFGITGAPVLSFGAAVPCGGMVGLAEFVRRYPGGREETHYGRREVLGATAGAVGLSVASYFVGSRGESGPASLSATGASQDEIDEIDRLIEAARERSLDVEGLEPLVSEDFYEVDINSVNPDVNQSEWSLTVTGEVEQEVTVDYEELRSMEAEHRYNTLRCVGEDLNGQKMDNAVWTGVPVWDIISRAGPQGGCECVMVRAVDNYYEEFPIDAMRDGFLAYGMNGNVLPRGHGFPARILVPGHWGEINVKWVNEIEVLDSEAQGYWEERGWHGTGPVNTVAKLHAINDLSDGMKQVAGHAYAGTRGIQTVEVSVDGGESWDEAELSQPLPVTTGEEPDEVGETPFGSDVWRQWKYEYDPSEATTPMVTVRARDGNGDLQPKERSDAFPSGPTGWVSRQVEM